MPKGAVHLWARGACGAARRTGVITGIASAAAMLLSAPLYAAPPPLSVPISSEQSPHGQASDTASFLSNLKRSNYMLGDMFGLRTFLSKYGISLAVQETSEVFGNVTGGTQKGAPYNGLTQLVMQLDTRRAFGWYGGLFNISALQSHGQNISADNLSTLQTASGIEADRATRLWELWYDQKFLEEDRLDIKVGQQSVDQEFIVSNNAAYFINTNSHVRLGAPEVNDGAQVLRRSYSYDNGLSFTAERWPPWRQGMEFDAGLLFVCFQRDPRTGFIKVFDKMSKFDMLNQFVTHVGGGLFACSPGAKEGGYIGQSLFELA